MTDISRGRAPEERVAEIRAELAAITPGPWVHVNAITGLNYICVCGQSGDSVRHYVRASDSYAPQDSARSDAQFIARSPETVAYLLSRVETLEAHFARLKNEAAFEDYINEHGLAPSDPSLGETTTP